MRFMTNFIFSSDLFFVFNLPYLNVFYIHSRDFSSKSHYVTAIYPVVSLLVTLWTMTTINAYRPILNYLKPRWSYIVPDVKEWFFDPLPIVKPPHVFKFNNRSWIPFSALEREKTSTQLNWMRINRKVGQIFCCQR